METESKQLGVAALSLLGIVCLIPVLAIYHGFVFSMLWRWYATPLFNAPAITTFQAAGLLILAGVPFLRLKATQNLKTMDYVGYFLAPLASLLVGWAFSYSI